MEADLPASIVVSVRLSPEERTLLEEAAAQRGWKLARFLRVSALERAAHVLNTSRPTSFSFQAAAERLAEGLVGPRRVQMVDPEANAAWGDFGAGPVDFPYADKVTLDRVRLEGFTPAPLSAPEMEQFREAVRLGGTEFVAQVVAECQRVLRAAPDTTLPPPIDPDALKG